MKKLIIFSLCLLLCLASLPVTASEIDPSQGYSRYDFTFFFAGSNDYYVGYVYAPTGTVTVGQAIYNEPETMGGNSLGGGYYSFTKETPDFDSSYDKKEYITSYHYSPGSLLGSDSEPSATRGSWLEVNSDASATGSYIYVSDRSREHEWGYAIYNSQPVYFNPYSWFRDPECYVPLPSTGLLLICGLVGLALLGRRKFTNA